MFIIYEGDNEVIICTTETENEALNLYFYAGGRDLQDYDRKVSKDCAVSVDARLRVE